MREVLCFFDHSVLLFLRIGDNMRALARRSGRVFGLMMDGRLDDSILHLPLSFFSNNFTSNS